MNEISKPWRRVDLIGTWVAALILVLAAFFAWLGISAEHGTRMVYEAFTGSGNVPWLTMTVYNVQKLHGLEALSLMLLLLGVWLLVTVKDRLRANLYACLAAVALASIGLVGLSSRILAIFDVVEKTSQRGQ